MKVFTMGGIRAVLPGLDLLSAIEEGFVAYSSGCSIVPPHWRVAAGKWQVHIKYGCIKDDAYYLVPVQKCTISGLSD